MQFLDDKKYGVEVDQDTAVQMMHFFKERAVLQAEMAEKEARKKDIDAELSTLMALSGVSSMKNEDGVLTQQVTTRAFLKKDLLQQELLTRGLAATAVVEIIEKSSTSSTSASLVFRPSKKNGGV